MKKIAIVEDDVEFCSQLCEIVKELKYTPVPINCIEKAKKTIDGTIDIFVLDMEMGTDKYCGLKVYHIINQHQPVSAIMSLSIHSFASEILGSVGVYTSMDKNKFNRNEFINKIQVLDQRSEQLKNDVKENAIITDLEINDDIGYIKKGRTEVILAPMQVKLFKCVFTRSPDWVRPSDIWEEVGTSSAEAARRQLDYLWSTLNDQSIFGTLKRHRGKYQWKHDE